MFMKTHKIIRKEQKANNKTPIPLRIRAPKDTRESRLTTATNLEYLQVTDTKSNIFMQKG